MSKMNKVEILNPIKITPTTNSTDPAIDVVGDVNITGDLVVSGEGITSQLENVVTPQNTITLRDGATVALNSGEYAGIVAEKYDGTNDGMLVFDKTGTAYVGDRGQVQPLATRNLTNDNKIVKWDKDNLTLVESNVTAKDNGSIVINDGTTSGSNSFASGTADSEFFKALVGVSVSNISAPSANGDLSISVGTNNKSDADASVTLGASNTTGIHGYKWTNIAFDTKTITLDTAPSDWAEGDYVTIVNGDVYAMCTTIKSVDKANKKVVVDNLPFTSNYYTISNMLKPAYSLPYKQTIYAIAITDNNDASAKSRYVLRSGSDSIVLGVGALATGAKNVGAGTVSTVSGYNTMAAGNFDHAEGNSTIAAGGCSHAEGKNTWTKGYAAHAEGYNNIASGYASHAEGHTTEATGGYAHVEGNGTKASNYCAHAEGRDAKATNDASHAEGNNTAASGSAAHAEGNKTLASGNYAHAEGLASYAHDSSKTITYLNHEGQTKSLTVTPGASGIAAHAEGENSTAFGKGSHAEGFGGAFTSWSYQVDGENSERIYKGDISGAFGEYSHVEGNYCVAYGTRAHAEGGTTVAVGNTAHAEGYQTIAFSGASHAEGNQTVAHGLNGHSEGCLTIAFGQYSHAEGHHTQAKGESSHAAGYYTKATAKYQTVIGKYNATNDDALFIIGNGTADNETGRKNLFEVTTNDGVKYNGNRLAATKTYSGIEVSSASTSSSSSTATKTWIYSSYNVYKQIIPVSGIKSTDKPIVDIDLTEVTTDYAKAQNLKAYSKLGNIETDTDKLILWVYNGVPSTTFKINVKVVD